MKAKNKGMTKLSMEVLCKSLDNDSSLPKIKESSPFQWLTVLLEEETDPTVVQGTLKILEALLARYTRMSKQALENNVDEAVLKVVAINMDAILPLCSCFNILRMMAKRSKERMMKCAIVETVLSSIETHSKSIELQCDASKLLRALAENDATASTKMISLGCPEALTKSLTVVSASEEAVSNLCLTLSAFCMGDESQTRMLEVASKAILKVMADHSASESVLVSGFRFFLAVVAGTGVEGQAAVNTKVVEQLKSSGGT